MQLPRGMTARTIGRGFNTRLKERLEAKGETRLRPNDVNTIAKQYAQEVRTNMNATRQIIVSTGKLDQATVNLDGHLAMIVNYLHQIEGDEFEYYVSPPVAGRVSRNLDSFTVAINHLTKRVQEQLKMIEDDITQRASISDARAHGIALKEGS